MVTKDSTFSLHPNNSQDTAQQIVIDPTAGGHGGALGYLGSGGPITLGLGIDGATGTDSNNNCGCLPPDTNAAVNDSYVVETVNEEFLVFDKASGTELFSEPLSSFFAPIGDPSIGDVYVVWDPSVGRWYVDAISANNEGNLLFAISNDSNPLNGFSNQYVIPSASSGDLADFPKFGYNADYITFAANDFGSGQAKVTVINKADALAGSLVDVQLSPSFQFRALVPAQDPTAKPGDPIWFTGFAIPESGFDQQHHPRHQPGGPVRGGDFHRQFRAGGYLRGLYFRGGPAGCRLARWPRTTTRSRRPSSTTGCSWARHRSRRPPTGSSIRRSTTTSSTWVREPRRW